METLLLKGKPASDSIRSGLEPRVKSLNEDGIVPQLAAIIIGDDPYTQFDKLRVNRRESIAVQVKLVSCCTIPIFYEYIGAGNKRGEILYS